MMIPSAHSPMAQTLHFGGVHFQEGTHYWFGISASIGEKLAAKYETSQ
jgi:hypothetical protein